MAAAPTPWRGLDALAPGTKGAFACAVVEDRSSHAAGPLDRLPVLYVRGANPGPTLLCFAGVHGDEFEPMAAVHDFYRALDPAAMTGSWVCVACAGVSGYLAANRLGSDGKNLARCFPGSADGTLTERVAHTLQRDFLELPEVAAFVDLHSAGKDYKMVSLVGYNLFNGAELREGDGALGAAGQALARAMALPLVWGHQNEPSRSLASALNDEKGSRTTLYGAYLAQKPAVYCETFATGGIREEDVREYTTGLKRALRHLGILPPAPDDWAISDGHLAAGPEPMVTRLDTVDALAPADGSKASSGHLQSQNLSLVGGLWRAKVDLWHAVEEGQLVGAVSDLYGEVLFELRAAKAGVVILLRHLARVEPGAFLLVLADADE